MKLICTENMGGFTMNKKYKLLGCAGEYVQLKDDNGELVIVYEGNFQLVR